MKKKKSSKVGLIAGTLVLSMKNLHFMSTVSLQELLVRVREIVVVEGGKK
jgi:hypothetical protein